MTTLLALLFWFSMDSGCIVDPLGGCSAETWAPHTDEGCAMDPLGGCRG